MDLVSMAVPVYHRTNRPVEREIILAIIFIGYKVRRPSAKVSGRFRIHAMACPSSETYLMVTVMCAECSSRIVLND